jgi:hypothetical protein
MAEPTPTPGRSRDARYRAVLATVGFQIVIGVCVGFVLELTRWLQLLIILAVLTLIAAVTTSSGKDLGPRAMRTFGEKVVNVHRWAFKGLLYSTPGIAVAALVFFGLPPVLSIGDPCSFSTELRVVTGAENVTALRTAANRYVAERSGDGCRQVAVTVSANSSITALRLGFANGWLMPGANTGGSGSAPQRVAFLGPRPDIWIPDSTAAADHVRNYVEDQGEPPNPLAKRVKAELHVDGTVGTSPMVVGVFTDYDRAGPSQTNLEPLLTRLRTQLGVEALVRPSPDTSEAALLSTPILYQSLRAGADPWASSDAEVERLLNTRGRVEGDPTALQTSDAAALLCRFRAAAARGETPPTGLAVVVPEKVLAAYNHGDDLGGDPGAACRGGPPPRPWRMSAYHTSDLPVLDHPFVQVRWPGEYTARRQQAIDEFRDWLGSDALTRSGFRTAAGEMDPPDGTNPVLQALPEGGGGSLPGTVDSRPRGGRPGCAATLQQTLDCYVAARPVTSLSLLVDVSGSMVQLAGPAGERTLLRAQEVAESIVSGARRGDQIRVRTFSTQAPPVSGVHTTISGDEERAALQAQIQQVAMTGLDLPFTAAIEAAARELRAGTQSLVLLTDGQVPRSNPGVADDAAALAARLRADNPALRVFMVLVGPRKCAEAPVEPLVAALGDRGSCVDGSAIPTEDIADGVISTILWGDQGR